MPELYTAGVHRVVYRAEGFGKGRVVKCFVWTPDLTKSSELSLTELGEGLYYIDYNFSEEGEHIWLFLEDGVSKTSAVYRLTSLAKSSIESVVEAIHQSQYGKKILTRDDDDQYTEVLYDGEGNPIRTHVIRKVGNQEIRENA